MKINLEEKYDNHKAAFILGGGFAILAFLYLLLLFWWNQRIYPVDVSGCQRDVSAYTYKMKKYYGPDHIKLEGYVYVKGQSIHSSCVSVIAYNPAEDIYYALPTEYLENKEITQKENDGCNYDACGFSSVVFARKVWNGTKFYIRCRNNGVDVLIDTGLDFNY